MLPAKKFTAVMEISAELLRRISRLMGQLITTRASEISPTLGEPIPLSVLLRSLEEAIRTTTELSLDQRAAILPALHAGREKPCIELELLPEEVKPLASSVTPPSPPEPTGEGEMAPPCPPPGTTPTPADRKNTATLQEKWAQFEANARACRRARQEAARKDKEAHRKVLAFAQWADIRKRAMLPLDFLDKVQKDVALQEHLDKVEAQEQKQEKKKEALKLEQL
ncbi:hypothetical protein TSAR_014818 [Trichomalopsis sarcophagae]|uniref:Uncharacterized protein n=1 Tax=Trichomalopsis sarcophagae TaxID=543379 RepID=A0A232EL51_9HYME|nr:hypothetical protein TSAR_014818 [Trichomalopsis sarcophagae]